jgi:aspartate carbamoyltransferase catalytic subunit
VENAHFRPVALRNHRPCHLREKVVRGAGVSVGVTVSFASWLLSIGRTGHYHSVSHLEITCQLANVEARGGDGRMSTAADIAASQPIGEWQQRHLLTLEELSREEIETVFRWTDRFRTLLTTERSKLNWLSGRLVVNLFFEPSTRTRISFSLAARRLGADTVDFTVTGSSVAKGESFIDTAKNLEAMGVDVMVVRHSSAGAPQLLAQHLGCAIVNAGDGAHEHPTQGLLDLYTIRRIKGRIAGLTVALVGDILHSRVARSNIHALKKLGAHVIVCGPATLVPPQLRCLGVEVSHNLDAILPRCDVVNLLRIQFERQRTGLFPSIHEYARLFGMDGTRLKRARPDILILAPGPINRGVEITPEVADGPHSAILHQVTNGLAVRMAVLYLLCQAGKR